MNKTELIRLVAEEAEADRATVKSVLDTTLQVLEASIAADEEVRLKGFGKFFPRHEPPQERRHPGNGSLIQTPARKTLAFRVSDQLRGRLPSPTES